MGGTGLGGGDWGGIGVVLVDARLTSMIVHSAKTLSKPVQRNASTKLFKGFIIGKGYSQPLVCDERLVAL